MRDPMPRLAAATRSFCSRSRSRRSALPLLPAVRRILQEGAQVLASSNISDQRLPLLPLVQSIQQVPGADEGLSRAALVRGRSELLKQRLCIMSQVLSGHAMQKGACVVLDLARPAVSQSSHTCWNLAGGSHSLMLAHHVVLGWGCSTLLEGKLATPLGTASGSFDSP